MQFGSLSASAAMIEFSKVEHGRDRLPAYSIQIYENGKIVFSPKKYTKTKKISEATISAEKVLALAKKMESLGFFSWDSSKASMSRGAQMKTLSLNFYGKQNTITYANNMENSGLPIDTIQKLETEIRSLAKVNE